MNTLYRYQEAGVKHLLSMPFGRPHALLADAPGTGKTIMTIEAAKRVGCMTGIILSPAVIKEQWRRQAISWNLCDEDQIQVAYGQDYQLTNAPWVVLNYDLVRLNQIKNQLRKRKWHVLVMDEAHRLKTHGSQQTLAVFDKNHGIAQNCYYKWALSGTIMPNRPAELYPILKCMAPEVIRPYDSWDTYIQHFCGGAHLAGKGASNIPELTHRIQTFMLRRQLEDVWSECPPLIKNEVWLDVDWQSHPEWVNNGMGIYEATERRIVAESKIPQIVAYLQHRLESGIDKIVCFTYHTKVLEEIVRQLPQFSPLKIYGETSPKQRDENLTKFRYEPHYRLFVCQIGSGGEAVDGLQYVCAEYVRAEPEWSPGREDQAGARLLRLGQTKPVIETKLFVSNSYEEVIYGSAQRKRSVIEVVLKPNGGDFIMTLESEIQEIKGMCAQILSKVGAGSSNVVPFAAPAASQFAAAPAQNAPQPFAAAPAPMGASAFAPPAFGGAPQFPGAPGAAPGAPPNFAPPQLPNFAAGAAPSYPQQMPSATTAGFMNSAPQTAPGQPAAFVPNQQPLPTYGNPDARVAFEKQVVEKLTKCGPQAPEVCQRLAQQFGSPDGRLGGVPEQNFPHFLAACG